MKSWTEKMEKNGSRNRLGRVHNAPERHLKNQVNAPATQGSYHPPRHFPLFLLAFPRATF